MDGKREQMVDEAIKRVQELLEKEIFKDIYHQLISLK